MGKLVDWNLFSLSLSVGDHLQWDDSKDRVLRRTYSGGQLALVPQDGTMHAMLLQKDRSAMGIIFLLTRHNLLQYCFYSYWVCFLITTEEGKKKVVWSSFGKNLNSQRWLLTRRACVAWERRFSLERLQRFLTESDYNFWHE